MVGICRSPSGQHFVWWIQIGQTTSQRLLRNANIDRDLKINGLELAAYVAHLQFFAPPAAPLDHIFTKVDNTVA